MCLCAVLANWAGLIRCHRFQCGYLLLAHTPPPFLLDDAARNRFQFARYILVHGPSRCQLLLLFQSTYSMSQANIPAKVKEKSINTTPRFRDSPNVRGVYSTRNSTKRPTYEHCKKGNLRFLAHEAYCRLLNCGARRWFTMNWITQQHRDKGVSKEFIITNET